MKTDGLGRILIAITAFALVILVADCILLGATGSVSIFTSGSLHALLLLFLGFLVLFLIGLFIANLIFIAVPTRKMPHFAMLLLILVTFEIILPVSNKWGHYTHRQWFFKTGMPAYQSAVEKIMRDKTVLTDEDRLLALVGRPAGCPYVHGETNADGSVTILFSGGDHWREGYLYYSGTQVVARPVFTNEFSLKRILWYESPFEIIIRPNYSNLYSIGGDNRYYYYHLTNGWYEQ